MSTCNTEVTGEIRFSVSGFVLLTRYQNISLPQGKGVVHMDNRKREFGLTLVMPQHRKQCCASRSRDALTEIVKLVRDSGVDIATGYGLDDQGVGVGVPVGARIFTSPCCPDRLWGPHNHLSNGYRWLFLRG
jgi:hypothetical protein